MSDLLQTDLLQPQFLNYPYSVANTGAPALTPPEHHLRDLIMQVLLTNPGERVNLPEFGVGVLRFVFEPNNDALRTTVQFLVSSNLQRWLGDRIDVQDVRVSSEPGYEEAVNITITYTIRATQQSQTLQVQV